MKEISIQKAAEYMGGVVKGNGNLPVSAVSTDTRKISGGELFFALKGENSDGHRYLWTAFENGAGAAVISDEECLPEGSTAVKVEDTLRGLQLLAKGCLSERNDLLRIGITGSTGKTSTKELLYASMKGKYRTARNMGNFNNHIGMPLTALSVEPDHQAAIFEMGMGGFGEVELLADIGRPDTAIITNIGVSHISDLGSRENILKAKLEITTFFDERSKLIINYDNDLLHAYPWEEECYKVIKVGSAEDCDYIIRAVRDLSETGVELDLEIKGKVYTFEIPVPGVHNGHNGALAVAAAVESGVEPELIAETIKTCAHTDKRLIIKTSPGGIKVIDDSYNASPDSMKSGIDVLMSVKGERKLLFLADMLGMGAETEKYHREVGEHAGLCGVDGVFTVGKDAAFISDQAAKHIGKDKVGHFETLDDLLKEIDRLVKPGDAVLVKASRALGMEKTAEYLLENR